MVGSTDPGHPRRRAVAHAAALRRIGPRRHPVRRPKRRRAAGPGAAPGVVRLQRLPGAEQSFPGDRGIEGGGAPLGYRSGGLQADLRQSACPPCPRGGSGRLEEHRGGTGVLQRIRSQPGGAQCAGGQRVRVVSDELNHASIIDGARLARAEVAIYPHLDIGAAHELLAEWPGRSVLVTDAVFSMDGDAADLGALTALCARHDAVLVVDEAHSVWGPELTGVARTVRSLSGLEPSRKPWVHRAASSPDHNVVDLLVNTARPFIFSTALSPSGAAAARRPRSSSLGGGRRAGSPAPRPHQSVGPRSPKPDRAAGGGRRGRRRRRIGGARAGGILGAGHPPPDGGARHQPPSHHLLRRPHRRAG